MRWLPVGLLTLTAMALVATYRPWSDGPLGSYALGIVLALLAATAAGAWLTCRGAAPVLLTLAVLGALLPVAAVHAVRLINRSQPWVVSLESPFAHRSWLDAVLGGDASTEARPEGLVLRVASGATGYWRIRGAGEQTAGQRVWWMPAGLWTEVAEEEVAGVSKLALDNEYFVLLDTEAVTIQLTRWGALVAPRGDDGAQRVSVGVSVPTQGWLEWSLHLEGGRLSFSAGEASFDVTRPKAVRQLWSGETKRRLGQIRLGETRTDREHGGTLELRSLRYSRFRPR